VPHLLLKKFAFDNRPISCTLINSSAASRRFIPDFYRKSCHHSHTKMPSCSRRSTSVSVTSLLRRSVHKLVKTCLTTVKRRCAVAYRRFRTGGPRVERQRRVSRGAVDTEGVSAGGGVPFPFGEESGEKTFQFSE